MSILKTTSNTIPFNDFKFQIQDLDIIFFKGAELVSDAIAEAEKVTQGNGDWSHVGLVISKRNLPNIEVTDTGDTEDTKYVWESTMSSTYKIITKDSNVDVEGDKGVFGVQLRRLDDVVISELSLGSKVGWGKLIDNPLSRKEENLIDYINRIAQVRVTLCALHTNYFHRSYPLRIWQMLKALFCCLPCRPLNNKGSVFCSQFVGIVYRRLGLIPKTIIDGEILPSDLAYPELSRQHLPKLVQFPMNILLQ